MPDSMCRYEIRFTGNVQGVGFRYSTCQVADGYDVAGWVRNVVDGSVRCVAEGSTDELDRFVAAIQKAMSGYIAEIQIQSEDATGEFEDFSIRF